MAKRYLGLHWLSAGILAGALLFFLCYWWLGTISVSAMVALVVVVLVAPARTHPEEHDRLTLIRK